MSLKQNGFFQKITGNTHRRMNQFMQIFGLKFASLMIYNFWLYFFSLFTNKIKKKRLMTHYDALHVFIFSILERKIKNNDKNQNP